MFQETKNVASFGSTLKKLVQCTKLNIFYCMVLSGVLIFIYVEYYGTNLQKVILSRQEELQITEVTPNSTESWHRSIELIIVVQVHNREMYLKHFIDSLKGAAGIETVLLIFSHDYIDEKLNKLIATIDFCKYKQIFYPYSVQKFPNTFPGPEASPVKGGTNRNATLAQVKHHWWWKANAIFNSIPYQNYTGLVLLLEEDYYMLEDFIPTLKQMEVAANEFCNTCKLFSLAVNLDAVNIYSGRRQNVNLVKITNRFSNMGLAFNATTWKEIVSCSDSFCKYNDNNWDFSLQNVLNRCLRNVDNMILMFPRLFHIGNCGVHVTSNNCDSSQALSKVQDKIKEVNGTLYPKKLELDDRARFGETFASPNGGWEDVRDHKLCENMTSYVIDSL